MLNPATIDSAAAATAPDATKRLRTKYGLDAATIPGTMAPAGSSGSGCPKVRDVKTSSKVASSFAPIGSGPDSPMILQQSSVRFAHASRSSASETQHFPSVTYNPNGDGADVSTRKRKRRELPSTPVWSLENRGSAARPVQKSCCVCAPLSERCQSVVQRAVGIRAGVGFWSNCSAQASPGPFTVLDPRSNRPPGEPPRACPPVDDDVTGLEVPIGSRSRVRSPTLDPVHDPPRSPPVRCYSA